MQGCFPLQTKMVVVAPPWDSVTSLIRSAQEKYADPLHLALQLRLTLASAGISLPSPDLAHFLVSHIFWDNHTPLSWKLLEKSITVNLVPPLLVLALLSPRKKKVVHKTTTTDDKRLQTPFPPLKKLTSLRMMLSFSLLTLKGRKSPYVGDGLYNLVKIIAVTVKELCNCSTRQLNLPIVTSVVVDSEVSEVLLVDEVFCRTVYRS